MLPTLGICSSNQTCKVFFIGKSTSEKNQQLSPFFKSAVGMNNGRQYLEGKLLDWFLKVCFRTYSSSSVAVIFLPFDVMRVQEERRPLFLALLGVGGRCDLSLCRRSWVLDTKGGEGYRCTVHNNILDGIWHRGSYATHCHIKSDWM